MAMAPTLGSQDTPTMATPISTKTKIIKRTKLGGFVSTMGKNIRNLFTAVKEFKDNENRLLSDAFLKLPSKTLYPDYYEVIFQLRVLIFLSFFKCQCCYLIYLLR